MRYVYSCFQENHCDLCTVIRVDKYINEDGIKRISYFMYIDVDQNLTGK